MSPDRWKRQRKPPAAEQLPGGAMRRLVRAHPLHPGPGRAPDPGHRARPPRTPPWTGQERSCQAASARSAPLAAVTQSRAWHRRRTGSRNPARPTSHPRQAALEPLRLEACPDHGDASRRPATTPASCARSNTRHFLRPGLAPSLRQEQLNARPAIRPRAAATRRSPLSRIIPARSRPPRPRRTPAGSRTHGTGHTSSSAAHVPEKRLWLTRPRPSSTSPAAADQTTPRSLNTSAVTGGEHAQLRDATGKRTNHHPH